MQTPTPFIAPEVFDNADAALGRVQAIYAQSVQHLRHAMQRFVAGEDLQDRVRACYPYVRIETATGWTPPADAETELLSYGFVASAGAYATTLTRPDLFADYLRAQFALLIPTTASAWRWAPARSPCRCISRLPKTSTWKAR